MAEITAAPFVLHGAREVLESGVAHIEEQIVALEEAVEGNAGLAFDLAKTLLESGCKTVLQERGASSESAWDLPRLLKETLTQLQLVPGGLEGDVDASGSLRKTLGGLQTVIHGICELRNTHGFASHGKDASFQQLESVQAILVARAADAIISFVFRVHREYPAGAVAQRLSYGDHPDFDDFVDEANELVRIFDLQYRPSEVLHQVDPDAYRDHLAGWNVDAEAEQEVAERIVAEETL